MSPEERIPTAGKKASGARLPFILELTQSVSRMILVVTALLVGGISIYSGSTILSAAFRVAATLLSLGVIFSLVFWIMAGGRLSFNQRAPVTAGKKKPNRKETGSTTEVSA